MAYNRWLENPDELYHYGVIGMKWGVHKVHRARRAVDKADRKETQARLALESGPADKETASRNMANATKRLNAAFDRYNGAQKSLYLKSSRKLQKLNAKYEKKQTKADRKFDKAERKANSFLSSQRSANRAFKKASKAQFKANKVAAKGKKWYERMTKAYKKADINMSKQEQEIGKELIRQVRANSRAMYAATYR